MFLEEKKFLSHKESDRIIKECSSLINKNQISLEYNRQGNSVEFSKHEQLKEIDQLVCERLNYFIHNRLIYTFALHGPEIADTGYSFHRYKDTDKLFTHADGVFSMETEKFYPRVLACVINLTDNENADLIFPRYNKAIKSEKGKLVAFLPHSCFEHYMNNNSGKNRDVIVTWLYNKNIECKKI